MLIDEEDDGFVFSLTDENNSIIRSHNIMKEKEVCISSSFSTDWICKEYMLEVPGTLINKY